MIQSVSKRRLIMLDERGHAICTEEVLPEVGKGQVLIRFRATMISAGTQLNGVRQLRDGTSPSRESALPLGYQAAGDVVQVGEGVTRLKPGDRVAAFGVGAQHADYGVVAQNLCFEMPDAVSYEEASGMNLVATALHAVRRAETAIGEFMLIVGLGVVGQLAGQFSRAAGMYVMGWDTIQSRIDAAKANCVDEACNPLADDFQSICKEFTQGFGFDNAIMAIGGNGTPALEQVKSVMKVTRDTHAMGKVVLVGGLQTTCSWGAGMGNLDLRSSARTGPGYHDNPWEHGEVEYPQVFMRWTTQTNIRLAMRMIADGRLNIKPLITHRFPLANAPEAVDLILEHPDQTLGVVLIPEDD